MTVSTTTINNNNPVNIVFEKRFTKKYADQYMQLLQDATVADHYIKTWKLYNLCRQSVGLSHPKTLDVCYWQLDIHNNLIERNQPE